MNLWTLAGLGFLGLASLLSLQLHTFKRLEFEIYRRTRFLNGRIIMSTQEVIDAVVAQLTKAKGELVGKLEATQRELQAQVDTAGVSDKVDLSALTAIAQELDDLVPDVEALTEVAEVEAEVAEVEAEAVEGEAN